MYRERVGLCYGYYKLEFLILLNVECIFVKFNCCILVCFKYCFLRFGI